MLIVFWHIFYFLVLFFLSFLLFEYLNLAIDFNDIINVNTKKGNVVIISEDEYNSLTETLYLTSIPGMKDRLEEGIDATIDDCVDFEW